MRALLPLFAMTIAACGSETGKLTDSGEDAGANGDFETHEESHADAPILERAVLVQRGGTCFIEGSYSDPQGPADVRRGTIIAVDPDSGEELWSDDLFVCVDHDCVGSFADHAEYSTAPCSLSDRYDYYGFVYDRSDLQSNIMVLEQ